MGYSSMMIAAAASYQFKINHTKTKNMLAGEKISLPQFRVGQHDWTILYYPQGFGKSAIDGEYLSLYLNMVPNFKSVDASTTFAFALQDKHGNVSSTTWTKCSHTFRSDRSVWGANCFLQRRKLEKNYIKDNCFTLHVSITIHDGSPNESLSLLLVHSLVSPQNIKNYKILQDRLQNSREENKQTDVSFVVDGEKFAAHRFILAAHSPVFEAELFGSMAESNIDCITINEMLPSVFKAMLDFMYNGTLPDDDHESSDSNVSDDEVSDEKIGDDEEEISYISFFQNLLVAADRYAVERLKYMCEHRLVNHISLNTVLSLLECAEKHDSSELKTDCLQFILGKDNSLKLMFSAGYIKLMHKYPSLLAELKKMANKLQQI
jgi:speckle-type POZ protein